MTSILTKLTLFAVPILLLFLTAIAGYAYSQIRSLSLPIPSALALFTLFLPLITGITTRGAYGLVSRHRLNNEPYQLTIPLIGVIGFQLIYETVVATLALTHLVPPGSLLCGLDQQWLHLWRVKDGDAIRLIQDTLNCCGLNSVLDRSFPFTDPATCSKYFHRTQACMGAWRQAEQINAGLLLLVAVVVFIIKVLSIISLLTGTSLSESKWARHFKQIGNGTENSEEDNRAGVRRLIEERSGTVGEYHDEPSEEAVPRAIDAPADGQEQGPRVVPSPLTEGGREWRD